MKNFKSIDEAVFDDRKVLAWNKSRGWQHVILPKYSADYKQKEAIIVGAYCPSNGYSMRPTLWTELPNDPE